MSKINLHNYEAFLIDYLDGNLSEASIVELKVFILANPQLDIDLEELDLPSFDHEAVNIDFKNNLKKNDLFIEDEELINYIEKNLSAEEQKAFELKLLNDKELTAKLNAYKRTVLNSENDIVFAGKQRLHKKEEDLILNDTAIAYVEDLLDKAEKLQFEKELNDNIVLQKELALLQKTKLVADNAIVFHNKAILKKETKVIALFSFRTVAAIAAAILLLFGLAFIFNYSSTKPVKEIKVIAKQEINTSKNTNKIDAGKRMDTIDKINNSIPVNSALIAKNTSDKENNFISKQKEDHELNETPTNSVVIDLKKDKSEPGITNNPVESNTFIANNKPAVDTISVNMANANTVKHSKQSYLINEEAEDDDVAVSEPIKKTFWQRAVKLAKQVNKLGVKSIDGEQRQGKNYALSFNSFSVEKR